MSQVGRHAEEVFDLRMAEATRRRRVIVPGGCVSERLVVGVSVRQGRQAVVAGEQGAEDDRQVLVVGDVLVLGDEDASRLLE